MKLRAYDPNRNTSAHQGNARMIRDGDEVFISAVRDQPFKVKRVEHLREAVKIYPGGRKRKLPYGLDYYQVNPQLLTIVYGVDDAEWDQRRDDVLHDRVIPKPPPTCIDCLGRLDAPAPEDCFEPQDHQRNDEVTRG